MCEVHITIHINILFQTSDSWRLEGAEQGNNGKTGWKLAPYYWENGNNCSEIGKLSNLVGWTFSLARWRSIQNIVQLCIGPVWLSSFEFLLHLPMRKFASCHFVTLGSICHLRIGVSETSDPSFVLGIKKFASSSTSCPRFRSWQVKTLMKVCPHVLLSMQSSLPDEHQFGCKNNAGNCGCMVG